MATTKFTHVPSTADGRRKPKRKVNHESAPFQTADASTGGIKTLNEWLETTANMKQEPQLIQDLLPYQPGSYGIIAGRTGIGKTNLALHLGFCLATGKSFFGLQCQKVGVAVLAAEGDRQNLSDRLMKIGSKFRSRKDLFHFEILPVQNPEKMLKEAVSKLADTPNVQVVVLDSAKYFVPGDYLKPSDVKVFVQILQETLEKLKMSGIITLPISKPQDKKGLIRPSDIYSIKGATEWVDSATFGILLEKKAYAKSNQEVTLSFAKHRIASKEMTELELHFDPETCRFRKASIESIELNGNRVS